MITCGAPAAWGIGRSGPCLTSEPALFMDDFAAIAQVQVRGAGRPLFTDLDAIDEVGGLAKAICGEIAILFVVQDQSFPHGL
jgi:hypothetical protein